MKQRIGALCRKQVTKIADVLDIPLIHRSVLGNTGSLVLHEFLDRMVDIVIRNLVKRGGGGSSTSRGRGSASGGWSGRRVGCGTTTGSSSSSSSSRGCLMILLLLLRIVVRGILVLVVVWATTQRDRKTKQRVIA